MQYFAFISGPRWRLLRTVDRKKLGSRIKALRKAAGMDQATLAANSGVSERSLSDIETGKANPALSTIEDIERTLDTVLIGMAEDSLGKPPVKDLERLINEPDRVAHATVSAVLARLLNETAQVRAATLAVLYGDSSIARLKT